MNRILAIYSIETQKINSKHNYFFCFLRLFYKKHNKKPKRNNITFIKPYL